MTQLVRGVQPAGIVQETETGCRVLAVRAPPVDRMQLNTRLVRLSNARHVPKAGWVQLVGHCYKSGVSILHLIWTKYVNPHSCFFVPSLVDGRSVELAQCSVDMCLMVHIVFGIPLLCFGYLVDALRVSSWCVLDIQLLCFGYIQLLCFEYPVAVFLVSSCYVLGIQLLCFGYQVNVFLVSSCCVFGVQLLCFEFPLTVFWTSSWCVLVI